MTFNFLHGMLHILDVAYESACQDKFNHVRYDDVQGHTRSGMKEIIRILRTIVFTSISY